MKKVVFSIKLTHENNPNDPSSAMIYWGGVLDKMGYEVIYYDYSKYNIDSLTKIIKDNKPEFFIHTNYLIGVHKEFDKLRDICKVFLLSSDAYRFHDSNLKHWIPFVDGVITFEGIKEWYLRDGLPEEGFLKMRWGFNPNMMCTSISPKTLGIQHYGGLHGGRGQKLNTMKQLGLPVDIYRFLTHTQIKEQLSKSKYSLCFSNNATSTRQELKGRVVEIPAYAVLLTEPAPDLDLYYNEDEIIIFNSLEEAKEKIILYESNTDLYLDTLNKGRKALWERNNAYHEWNKILPLMDPDYVSVDPMDIISEHHSQYYNGEPITI